MHASVAHLEEAFRSVAPVENAEYLAEVRQLRAQLDEATRRGTTPDLTMHSPMPIHGV